MNNNNNISSKKNGNIVFLKITISDFDSGKAIPAWIKLENKDEEKLIIPPDSVYNPRGFPVSDKKVLELPHGNYCIKASKGLTYIPANIEFTLETNKNLKIKIKRRYDLQKNGWFCSGCHNHVNYPTDIKDLVMYLEGKEIDSVSLCQGWLTKSSSARAHNGKKLKDFIEQNSSKNTHLYMGAEFPKTRFGHTCWWKFPEISDPFSCYNSYHDISYFDVAGRTEKQIEHPADEIPYTDEPPIFKIERWKDQGGVNMMPHPTSWWMDNSNASVICTNIAVDYCYDLISERLYDTLVVMGYDSEQIFYQNLWFHLLNEGYRIAGVAETDGNISSSEHQIGDFRTYAQIKSDKFDREKFLNTICKGNAFVSNGPLLFVTADKKHLPGSVIRNDGKQHTLNVDVYSSADPEEYISWVVVYKNGKPLELIDLEKKKLRHWQHDFKISTYKNVRDWYLVKVYGKNRPPKKEFTDIIKYAELCEKEVHTEYQKITGSALSNPFYFEPPEYKEPKPVKPPFTGKITDESTGKPIADAKITVSKQAKLLETCITDESGKFSFSAIPLTAEIKISKIGYEKILTSLFLHYEPLKKYFEYIYAGSWAIGTPNLQPGQVPWNVFNFKKLKKITNKIKWDFKLKK
jgi:desulfoferrodoxin (superoxide reductase-like protein)